MYRAKPLSRKKIRTRAKIVRKVLDVSDRNAFPVMDFLEKYLPLMRVWIWNMWKKWTWRQVCIDYSIWKNNENTWRCIWESG